MADESSPEITRRERWGLFTLGIASSFDLTGRLTMARSLMPRENRDLSRSPRVAHSSFFRRLYRASSRTINDDTDLKTRLAKLERAIELQYLARPQAEEAELRANAVATLLNALQSQSSAAIRIGTLLIVKRSDSVLVRHLSGLEIKAIDTMSPADIAATVEQLDFLTPDDLAENGLAFEDVVASAVPTGTAVSYPLSDLDETK